MSLNILRPTWIQASKGVRLRLSHLRFISQLPLNPDLAWSIEKCPSPTCACATTPENLDIDHKEPLAGKIPRYDQHVVICTGRTDWTSRIEDDEGGSLVKGLKRFVTRELSQQGKNLLVTNSSLVSTPSRNSTTVSSTSAYLFPSFRYVEAIDDSEAGYQSTATDAIRTSEKVESFDEASTRNVNELMVLICGHGGRDKRCGIMGPLLASEFRRSLLDAGVIVTDDESSSLRPTEDDPQSDKILYARVALVSHIGGHKWAGNVILYFAPAFYTKNGLSPLAGKGVWYGRVEPRHVQGIIQETVQGGIIIKELYRGGVAHQSSPKSYGI